MLKDLLIKKVYAQTIDDFQGLFNFRSYQNLNFTDAFGRIITLLTAIIGFIAFIYLVISGIQYITSGGDPEKANKARQSIINALIGIAVIVLAWALIKFIRDRVSTGV